MTDTPTLEARGLTKRHRRRTVVDDMSFTVRRGTITGFLGSNGAGKSTTIRLFMGLDRPSAGQALIDGRPLADWPQPGRKVGAALSNRCAHPGRTALDSLRWVALLLDLPEEACAAALDRVGLAAAAHRRTGEFSLGMRQRLALATALMGEPEVLVLDEPMNGLDPQGMTWLRGLLEDVRAEGRTVFLASHLLRELEDLVDDLVVVSDGRVVESGSMVGFLDKFREETVMVRCDDVHALVTAVRGAGGQLRGTVRGDRVTVVGLSAREIGRLARDLGLSIEEMATERSLETAFEAATAQPSHAAGGVQR
jgi:ABC-2 type transport system ATP-binding protein